MMLPKEIFRGYDEHGAIIVRDDGNRRFLSFGETDEQSCVLKASPEVPQYTFIRAMLYPLMHFTPKRVLTLGLGAGSLTNALHSQLPELKQTVVELSPLVVDVAHRFFYLPRSKRIEIITADAFEFLQRPVERRYDMVVSDLYNAEGLNEIQMESVFIDACQSRLSQQGWLVLNCWSDHREAEILDHLKARFESIYTCTTEDGNWVLFATNSRHEVSQSQLKSSLKSMSDQSGFAFNSIAKRVRRLG
jgi:spermidine synthase